MYAEEVDNTHVRSLTEVRDEIENTLKAEEVRRLRPDHQDRDATVPGSRPAAASAPATDRGNRAAMHPARRPNSIAAKMFRFDDPEQGAPKVDDQ